MKGLAAGTAVGVVLAVILAGFVVAVLDVTRPAPRPPKPERPPVVRLGPDGTDRTTFGDDVDNAVVPGSERYSFCYGELRVLRPSMMTTGMPDAFCSLTRQSARGPWRITTGGWQECQAVCIRGKP